MPLPGYTWDSPITFGEVQELGPDAYFATYPADVEYEKAQIELVVVHTPRESVATMTEGGADPRTLALVTFLGLSGRPDQINKTLFMGGTEARTVFSSNIPRRHTAHVYQKLLDDGSMVTVGLRDFGGSPPPLVGEVLRGIADTFVSTSTSGP
jgi:hypothetical protein